ncbi:MAG: inorganic diphosphatase [Arsenophonus sp.]|nr:MAG: inorganic diphosphatase [Arsenophonus sp.]
MSLSNIPAGAAIPEDIYVIIEIPAHSHPIKYEINKIYDVIFVDRFVSTPMFYPCNYGYINNTISLDGDPIDVLVPTPYPLQSGVVIHCRPIGVLQMIDESGEDVKVIAVPHSKLTKQYENIQDINDFPELLRSQIQHFFEHYKDLEKNKWVKIKGWGNIDMAKNEIISSFNRFIKK